MIMHPPSSQKIDAAIDELRASALDALRSLD